MSKKNNNDKNEIDPKLQAEKDALLAEIIGIDKSNDSDNDESQKMEEENITEVKEEAESQTETSDSVPSADSPDVPSDESTNESDKETTISLSKSTSMPKYGKGYIYMPIVIGVTIISAFLGRIKPFSIGVFTNPVLRYIYLGVGIASTILGLFMFIESVSEADILTNAQLGNLVTTGIYSKSRNPMYGGILFICSGALFICGNVYTFVLPILYWLFLYSLMNNTEEPMLEENFGEEYLKYKKSTHRIIPLPKKDQ